MKKILSAIILTSFLVLPIVASAEIDSPEALVDKITDIGEIARNILFGVAAFMLILAGFFWVTAGGKPENVTKASDMLRNALIGVAVALLATGLVQVVKTIFA